MSATDDPFNRMVAQLAAGASSSVRDDKLRNGPVPRACDVYRREVVEDIATPRTRPVRNVPDGLTRRQKKLIRKGRLNRDEIMALKRARPVMPDEF